MNSNERTTSNPIGKILGILLLLLIVAVLIALFTPIGKPLQFALKTATTTSNLNFKGLTETDQPGTKTVNLNTPCNVNTKYSDKVFKEPTLTQAPVDNIAGSALLKLSGADDKSQTEFSINCNRVIAQVESIKNYVINAWTTKPEFEKQFGKTLDEVKGLTRVEFFKLFTSKTNPTCSIKEDLDKQIFLAPSLIKRFQKTYTYCEINSTNQAIKDYYLLPTDESDVILVIRSINADKFKSDLLVF
jgi:hypothetical protein